MSGRSRAQSFAIPDGALDRVLQELASPIASIPEAERIGFYRGLERIARQPHGQTVGYRYDRAKLAGAALKIANAIWPDWPPQQPATANAAPRHGRQAGSSSAVAVGDPRTVSDGPAATMKGRTE
jgi:hypothetical protein